MIIEEPARSRAVKGWAFMGLPPEDVEAICKYLEDGDTEHLPSRGPDDAVRDAPVFHNLDWRGNVERQSKILSTKGGRKFA